MSCILFERHILIAAILVLGCSPERPSSPSPKSTPYSAIEVPLVKPDLSTLPRGCLALEPHRPDPPVERAQTLDLKSPYDWMANISCAKGAVIAEVVVTSTGDVCGARIVKGLTSSYDEAVWRALLASSFAPATLEGEGVASFHMVTMRVGWDVRLRD